MSGTEPLHSEGSGAGGIDGVRGTDPGSSEGTRSPTGAASFESNLLALSARLPDLAALLRSLGTGVRPLSSSRRMLEIVDTVSAEPSARLADGKWLHSSRAPRDEARRIARAALAARSGTEAPDTVVICGFGLGYLAEACLEALCERVLVFEASAELMCEALRARDLAGPLADTRLGFVLGPEAPALVSALELCGARSALVLDTASARGPDAEAYGSAREAVERWNAKGRINEATLKRFGRLWVRNLAKNLGRLAAAGCLEDLEGAMAGLPALVLSAGPSLDHFLPEIRELARRAVVVCVDTALRSLLGEGIEPDFLVVVDPQYWNYLHVAGLSIDGSLLVSEATVWPVVLRSQCPRMFLGASLFPLGRLFDAPLERRIALGAGGSVSTSAWDLARVLGCDPIWMAGLDLGFPGRATHARASFFEQRSLCEGRRLAPAENSQAAALFGAGAYEAPSAGGGRVLTDRRMALYAWWFESRLLRPNSPCTKRIGQEGLAIPGLSSCGIEELLALPDIRPEIANRRESLLASLELSPSARAAREAVVEETRRSVALELSRIESVAVEAAKTAERAARRIETGLGCSEELRLLDRADSLISGRAVNELIGFLMPSLRELVGDKGRDLAESLARTEALYRSLAESTRFHREAMEGSVQGRIQDAG